MIAVELLMAYAAFGLLFAVVFVVAGVGRIDHAAAGSGLGFRLMILPGAAALWPLLLVRWINTRWIGTRR